MLALVTVPAQADGAPVVRLLPHPRAAANANVRNLNSDVGATRATRMAPNKVAVLLRTPAG